MTFLEIVVNFTNLLSVQDKLIVFFIYCILISIIYFGGILANSYKLEKENQKLKSNNTGLLQQINIYKNNISSLKEKINDQENILFIIENNIPQEKISEINQRIDLYKKSKIKGADAKNENSKNN